MIFEIDLLQHHEVKTIQQILNNVSYVPGKTSVGVNEQVKLSEVMSEKGPNYENIYNILSNLISENNIFSSLLGVKKITPPIIAKYSTGCFYDWHVDAMKICDVVTHYSMTIFLNEPTEYVGGELVIKRDGKLEEYKLGAGKALIYSTGMLHKVNKVESGTRLVSICWLESLISDEFMRTCIFEMGKFISDMHLEFNNSVEANKNLLPLEQIRINMMRQYGKF
jgi:PKHD-type hydroxylase